MRAVLLNRAVTVSAWKVIKLNSIHEPNLILDLAVI